MPEADLMVAAMCDLAAENPELRLVVARDPALPPLQRTGVDVAGVSADPMLAWPELVADVDGVLLVAPESEQLLSRLARRLRDADARLLISSDAALATAGDKTRLADILGELALPGVHAAAGAWVQKPVHGAGGEDCLRGSGPRATRAADTVLQPYCSGRSFSLNGFIAWDGPRLLCVNEQFVDWPGDRFVLGGILVNLPGDERFGACCGILERVVQAIPGLYGFIGIDVVDCSDAGMRVVDVNARLCTPSARLRAATGINVIRYYLDDAARRVLPSAQYRGRAVPLLL